MFTFSCKRNDSGRYVLNMLKSLIIKVCLGSPYSNELQKSNLEVIKACTRISVVWRVMYFLMRLIFRR